MERSTYFTVIFILPHNYHVPLDNSLYSPAFRKLLLVARCCKSLPKASGKKSNLFFLKISLVWIQRETLKRFLANALRCHETLLLYSINYLLFSHSFIPESMLKISVMFVQTFARTKKGQTIANCLYLEYFLY